jgi:hypothetical protein
MHLSSSLLENSVLHNGQVFFCMGGRIFRLQQFFLVLSRPPPFKASAKFNSQSCLSFSPSAALRQNLHTTSMRLSTRLADRLKSGPIFGGINYCRDPKRLAHGSRKIGML